MKARIDMRAVEIKPCFVRLRCTFMDYAAPICGHEVRLEVEACAKRTSQRHR